MLAAAAAAAAAARLAAAAVSKGPAWRILGAAGQQLQYSSDIPLVGSAAGAGGAGQLVHKEPETPLLRSIRNRILVRGGPLSVAEYMQEVLTNPSAGFYMHRDVFGASGDFVTSPEISQMFGEMIGIWCLVTWMHLGQPPALQLVELGPGRGTLMSDLLRGTAGFESFSNALSVHLVELSPALRQLQYRALRCHSVQRQDSPTSPVTTSSSSSSASAESTSQRSSIAHANTDTANSSSSSMSGSDVETATCGLNGCQVTWHSSLATVPDATPTIYLAHEFMDALPVHQFVHRGASSSSSRSSSSRGGGGSGGADMIDSSSTGSSSYGSSSSDASTWREVMVDVAEEGDPGPHHLRFVVSPSPTPATQLLVPRRLAALPPQDREAATALEVSAHAMAVAEQLALRIARHTGAALIIDYGRDRPYDNSLTAIRAHQGVSPLSQPGSADLSAWVDFSALRLAAEQAEAAAAAQKEAAAAAAASSAAGAGSSSRRVRGAGRSGAAVMVGAPTAAPRSSSTTRQQQQQQGVADAAADSSNPSSRRGQEQQQAQGSQGVAVWGPSPQADLLHALGIQARLQALAEGASEQQAAALLQGYQRLTGSGPEGMGVTYQALAITSSGLPAPVGFEGGVAGHSTESEP